MFYMSFAHTKKAKHRTARHIIEWAIPDGCWEGRWLHESSHACLQARPRHPHDDLPDGAVLPPSEVSGPFAAVCTSSNRHQMVGLLQRIGQGNLLVSAFL